MDDDILKGLGLKLDTLKDFSTFTITTYMEDKQSAVRNKALFDHDRASTNDRAKHDRALEFVMIEGGIRVAVREFTPQDSPLGYFVRIGKAAPQITLVLCGCGGWMRGLAFIAKGKVPKFLKEPTAKALLASALANGFDLVLHPQADAVRAAQNLVSLGMAYEASEAFKAEEEEARLKAEKARRERNGQPPQAPRWGDKS